MSYISKITLPDGSSYDIKDSLNNLYAVCSSTGASAYKDITLPDAFGWQEGTTIHVLFANANSNAAPSLRINNTTSALIDLPNGNITPWEAGEVVSFTYNGSVWKINDYGKVEVIRL